MANFPQNLQTHLQSGVTLLCHCWLITRKDGAVLGFTDHDMALGFDGHIFRADTGLSAAALAQATGLSVDNSEAMGALSDDAIREDEIEQGRYDGAEIRAWRVNWADPAQRTLLFRGTIGEVKRNGNAFRAELRGLTEALNRPLGRVYQKPCAAVLGDAQCQFNLATEGYSESLAAQQVIERREYIWPGFLGPAEGWFTRGRLEVLDGPAAGLWSIIKHDWFEGETRHITLWEPIRGAVEPGTQLRLVAGCDKRFETCRDKFANLINFQGFPDLPGDDWAVAVPKGHNPNTGGSLR
ncbi:MAG: DUF2163 domain-containing protein [Sulfitobacter sp.]